jgi:hypothetical protein
VHIQLIDDNGGDLFYVMSCNAEQIFLETMYVLSPFLCVKHTPYTVCYRNVQQKIYRFVVQCLQ